MFAGELMPLLGYFLYIFNSMVTGTFTAPEQVGVTPSSLLWLVPLVGSIAAAYKVTKLPTITAGNFIKETLVLFGSIVVFIAITAVVLFALTQLIVE